MLGRPLTRPELEADFRAENERKLAQARAALEQDPDDVEARIWVGRRTAYLGRYREAIASYTEAIQRHPDDPRLYRHRGHRFITLRRFDDAVADLERAAVLLEGMPEQVEPDGIPNARGIPTSTLQTNVFYHLGLVHYLRGDFEKARAAYQTCLSWSHTPDMQVATSRWLYTTLGRLGDEQAAAAILEPISADLDIIENHAYHQLLLMHGGELSAEDLLAQARAGDPLAFATTAYGIAEHWQASGDERARALLEEIVAGESWAAFGFIAAEAELAR